MFGGAVTVHTFPEQDIAGKIVLWPMLLPCVLDTEPISDTRRFAIEPDVTVKE